MRIGATIAALFLATAAGGRPQDPVKEDLDRLQGTWKLVSTAWDGTTSRAAEGDKAVVTGDRLVVTRGGKDQEMRFTALPGMAPKGIDLTPKEGPAGYHLLGIYNLDGDTLVLCYRLPVRPEGVGKARPSEFKAGPKSYTMMLTLERARAR
jgi:uncharacterized protein (TIGR03067 family)